MTGWELFLLWVFFVALFAKLAGPDKTVPDVWVGEVLA